MNIIVISQNVKLASLDKLIPYIDLNKKILIVSTQLIFENEIKLIDSLFGEQCTYISFSDLMSDHEAAQCDQDAFEFQSPNDLQDYFEGIKKLKNMIIIKKLLEKYSAKKKFIVSNDLGLHLPSWINAGFIKIECEYYYNSPKESSLFADPTINTSNVSSWRKAIKKISNNLLVAKLLYFKKNIQLKYHFFWDIQMYVAKDSENTYCFLGSMNRIAYRLRLNFNKAGWIDRIRYFLKAKGWFRYSRIICLSTLHEGYHRIPDRSDMNVKLLQDGYLPPNYSSKYLMYYGKFTEFWTWDIEGLKTFHYHHLPCRVIPIRKKLFLPDPDFPRYIRKVLCAASGDGDWTAVKNRSDEDHLVVIFSQLAALFPQVEFIFRCHPVWIHPAHQGVNSINRVRKYFDYLRLPNLRVSSNIPSDGATHLSFKRSSYEDDLKDIDLVLGEHSIAMLDAGFHKKLFCSVNVTGHRDFYLGMTEMGFPHCESLSDIVQLFNEITSNEFKERYMMAVRKYNDMTDQDE